MMRHKPLKMVFIGLSISSSWGNGHATTYRSLLRQLALDGHRLLFLERDVPWYAANRDLWDPSYCRIALYATLEELKAGYQREVASAEVVVVGSYVPDGIEIGDWVLGVSSGVTAFYDIDTPVTLASLASGTCEYLRPDQIPRYDLYLSFAGGPTLVRLEQEYGASCARPLYCSADPEVYFPEELPTKYDLGYLGTYSHDRQFGLERLLLGPARTWNDGRFAVAGPQYPQSIQWPANVHRVEHLPPSEHRAFYCQARFTLNLTRADMIRAGYAPSVRLFEAAACGVPVISDYWPGLESFFVPDQEILIASDGADVLRILRETPDERRQSVAESGRERVRSQHTARHRADELVQYVKEVRLHSEGATSIG